MNTGNVVEEVKPKRLGRPPLSPEEKAARAKKRIQENASNVEVRDCMKIYFSPLQFARLRDYHKQGGSLPGETIRLAVDAFFRDLMATGEYEPSEEATPANAKKAWEARVNKKVAAAREEEERLKMINSLSGGDETQDWDDEFPPAEVHEEPAQ